MAGLLPKNQETKDYLRKASEGFGDVEFIGDLVNDLSSNRYFPGQGGNAGMAPIAGGKYGPYNSFGQDKQLYDQYRSYGASPEFANDLAMIEPAYNNYVTTEDIANPKSGGKYVGPVDYNDPKFGLVKLGLYGNGMGMTPEDEQKLAKDFIKAGAAPEKVENYLAHLRNGNQDMYNAMTKQFPTGEINGLVEDGFGSIRQESDTWVGNINLDPGQLERENSFGKYQKKDDEIYVDPNSKTSARTTSHELMHRGIEALEREYEVYGSDPRYFSNQLGDNYPAELRTDLGRQFLGINPDTGKGLSIADFLNNRKIGSGKGHTFEHNMINSLARGRAVRSNYLGYDPSIDKKGNPQRIIAENASRGTTAEAAKKLGLLANAIVDKNQQFRHDSINRVRDKFPDNPYAFGGKSGTMKSPLLDSGY